MLENNKRIAKNTVFDKIFQIVSSKINRSNERSTNAIKNILASLGIKSVNIVAQLMLVPIKKIKVKTC